MKKYYDVIYVVMLSKIWTGFSNNILCIKNVFIFYSSESSAGLCGLMEDKEVAARAVAFVVNSTRKGIIPLCADVANLMRSRQR